MSFSALTTPLPRFSAHDVSPAAPATRASGPCHKGVSRGGAWLQRRALWVAAALCLASPFASWAATADANRASQAELEEVKGIGPALAQKILAARKERAFRDWADFIDRVPGVGPGNAKKFAAGGLTVGQATLPGAGAGANKVSTPTTSSGAAPAAAKTPAPAAGPAPAATRR